MCTSGLTWWLCSTIKQDSPPIEPSIQATVYNGLLHERQLEVTYRAITSSQEPKTYPVRPLDPVGMEQVGTWAAWSSIARMCDSWRCTASIRPACSNKLPPVL